MECKNTGQTDRVPFCLCKHTHTNTRKIDGHPRLTLEFLNYAEGPTCPSVPMVPPQSVSSSDMW